MQELKFARRSFASSQTPEPLLWQTEKGLFMSKSFKGIFLQGLNLFFLLGKTCNFCRGWGGLPYKKDGGACQKFWKEPQDVPKVPFYGCGLNCFSPWWGTNSKTKHSLRKFFFRLNTLKGTTKAPAVDLSRVITLTGTRTAFLTPKMYAQWESPPFTWESPAPCPLVTMGYKQFQEVFWE